MLIAEDDWRSIQETLHLLSIPGMRESIIEGLKTPVEVSWKLVFTRQAQRDAKKLQAAGLRPRAEKLLDLL